MISTSIVYRLLFAALAALGMTSLIALSLSVSLAGFFLGAPGLPFAILFAVLTGSDAPLIFPLSVFLGYLCVALLFVFWKPSDGTAWRRRTLILLVPVAILAALACIPRLDPLIPQGMSALKQQESDLTFVLANKSSLSEIRQTLQQQNIEFREETEPDNIELLSRGSTEIRASAGDHVVFNHLALSDVKPDGGAWQFPCRYDLQFILVFGQDEKLKQHYIGDSRLCP